MQPSLKGCEDTVCVQTCKLGFPRAGTLCPFYEQGGLLFGSGRFGFNGRLTGFRGARNIVRVRTKFPAAQCIVAGGVDLIFAA
jgi:hypothetical protein